MFANSALARTGQLWKFWLAIVALLIGCIAPAFPSTGLSWTAGTILAIAGYAYGLWFIRCPECGDRWMWQAALDAGLYKPLMTKPECPACARKNAAANGA